MKNVAKGDQHSFSKKPSKSMDGRAGQTNQKVEAKKLHSLKNYEEINSISEVISSTKPEEMKISKVAHKQKADKILMTDAINKAELKKIDNISTIMKQNYLSSITIDHPKKTQILIDTGAIDINLITKKYFDEITKDQEKTYQKSSILVKPIGSKPLKNYGLTQLSLELGKGIKTEQIPFIIIDQNLQYDVILGIPAISQLNIQLDIQNGIATIDNKQFKLNINQFTNRAEIRAKNKQILKPGTEQSIEVEVDQSILQNDKDNFHMIVPSKTLKQTKILETPHAVAKNHLSHILIGNKLNREVVVQKGALLGHLIATNPKENLHFIIEEPEDEIEEKIYIPNNLKPEVVNLVELTQHLNTQMDHLDSEQQNKLTELLSEFLDLFATNPNKPGLQTKTKMHVQLKEGTTPIKLPPYRAHPLIHQEIKSQVNQLLEDGLIEKANSPWSFPVVVVKKPDGSFRFCVDYSKLTKSTIKDTYPLPRIDDTLDYLSNAKYFTVVDASSGFWQIPIAEEDKEKLAFCTTFGTYQWKVMPFGFTNAPSVFQRAMNETLDDDLFQRCLVYIDDICIFSK